MRTTKSSAPLISSAIKKKINRRTCWMLSSAKKVVSVSEQHARYFLQNYLFMPKSLHQLPSDVPPTTDPVNETNSNLLIHASTWVSRINANSSHNLSRTPFALLLIWLITSVLASGDPMGRAQMKGRLRGKGGVFAGSEVRDRHRRSHATGVQCFWIPNPRATGAAW